VIRRRNDRPGRSWRRSAKAGLCWIT
jgi:hypothetical protein